MASRTHVVKELFENTAHYLKYDYNLQIRKETVAFFVKTLSLKNVLDMPCGTGEISSGILNSIDQLMLMDISENMSKLAFKNIPEQYKNRVELHNSDFFLFDFKNKRFDLVISLGLLAHVDSPQILINKLSTLVEDNGYLIVQNTDSKHFYNYLIRFYLGVKNIFRKQTYKLNNVSGQFIEDSLKEKGFITLKKFRYNQSFLGFSNFFSNERKYKMTKWFFGNSEIPKNQSWGSDVTYLFKKVK